MSPTVGFEIEVVAPKDRDEVRLALNAEFRGPIFGSLVPDRSIHARSARRTCEVRSPICASLGEAQDMVARIVRVLRSCGCKATATSGFHVHVGVPAGVGYLDALAAIQRYWLGVQEEYLAVAYGPKWATCRARLARVAYCRLWGLRSIREEAAKRPEEADRYWTLNPQAVSKHHTLEYRLWPMVMEVPRLWDFLRLSYDHAVSIPWGEVMASDIRAELGRIAEDAERRRNAIREEVTRRFREKFHKGGATCA